MDILLLKLLKFVAVGCSGLILDFGITWLLKEKLGIQKYIANATGFYIAASSNYLLNRIWTFGSTNPAIAYEYTLFIGISVAGLAINSLVLWFFTSRVRLNFYVAKLIATLVTTAWNFTANLLLVFTA